MSMHGAAILDCKLRVAEAIPSFLVSGSCNIVTYNQIHQVCLCGEHSVLQGCYVLSG